MKNILIQYSNRYNKKHYSPNHKSHFIHNFQEWFYVLLRYTSKTRIRLKDKKWIKIIKQVQGWNMVLPFQKSTSFDVLLLTNKIDLRLSDHWNIKVQYIFDHAFYHSISRSDMHIVFNHISMFEIYEWKYRPKISLDYNYIKSNYILGYRFRAYLNM